MAWGNKKEQPSKQETTPEKKEITNEAIKTALKALRDTSDTLVRVDRFADRKTLITVGKTIFDWCDPKQKQALTDLLFPEQAEKKTTKAFKFLTRNTVGRVVDLGVWIRRLPRKILPEGPLFGLKKLKFGNMTYKLSKEDHEIIGELIDGNFLIPPIDIRKEGKKDVIIGINITTLTSENIWLLGKLKKLTSIQFSNVPEKNPISSIEIWSAFFTDLDDPDKELTLNWNKIWYDRSSTQLILEWEGKVIWFLNEILKSGFGYSEIDPVDRMSIINKRTTQQVSSILKEIENEDENEIIEKLLTYKQNTPEDTKEHNDWVAFKYARVLSNIMEETEGKNALARLVGEIKALHEQNLNLLGLDGFIKENTWIFWDIAKQCYLYENPTESDTEHYHLGNPFEEIKVKSEIAQKQLGWEVNNQYDIISQPIHSYQLTALGTFATNYGPDYVSYLDKFKTQLSEENKTPEETEAPLAEDDSDEANPPFVNPSEDDLMIDDTIQTVADAAGNQVEIKKLTLVSGIDEAIYYLTIDDYNSFVALRNHYQQESELDGPLIGEIEMDGNVDKIVKVLMVQPIDAIACALVARISTVTSLSFNAGSVSSEDLAVFFEGEDERTEITLWDQTSNPIFIKPNEEGVLIAYDINKKTQGKRPWVEDGIMCWYLIPENEEKDDDLGELSQEDIDSLLNDGGRNQEEPEVTEGDLWEISQEDIDSLLNPKQEEPETNDDNLISEEEGVNIDDILMTQEALDELLNKSTKETK